MSVKAATTNDVSCKQLEYFIFVHWLRGVKPYERRSQALADRAVSFEGGGLLDQARVPPKLKVPRI